MNVLKKELSKHHFRLVEANAKGFQIQNIAKKYKNLYDELKAKVDQLASAGKRNHYDEGDDNLCKKMLADTN